MAYIEQPRKMGLSGSGDPDKPAIQSQTIISALVALIAWIVSFWGQHLSEYDVVQLTDTMKTIVNIGADLVGVVATISSIYYRYTATEKIEGIIKTPTTPTLPSMTTK